MSNLAVIERQPPRSVIVAMSNRYEMEPAAFEATLRATVFPHDGKPAHLAAFLLVAKQYGLNPITKEIYAFPTKGGGIQPIVSIDGWMNLMNSHPQMDGLEFEDIHDKKGEITAIRCRIYRKDRSRPVEVTEYMAECKRPTDTWNRWPVRMLRHKAAIQAARYAFGFAGIVEPDEWERSPENPATAAVPMRAPAPPPAPAAEPSAVPEPVAEAVELEPDMVPDLNPELIFRDAEARFAEASDWDQLLKIYEHHFARFEDQLSPPDRDHLIGIFEQHEKRFEP